MALEDFSVEELLEAFHYDPETGDLFWKNHPTRKSYNGKKAGSITRSMARNGKIQPPYWRVKYRSSTLRISRLIWVIMTGEYPIRLVDHDDGNTLNNRWVNLRLASPSENSANRASWSSTGFKGVTKKAGKFQAAIAFNKKRIHLGTFNTAEEAHAAYMTKAKELHGEFASDGKREKK